MNDVTADSFSNRIAGELPYLRRYARALTGSQSTGDKFAVATLEALLEEPNLAGSDVPVKVGLFKTFHSIWSSSGAPVEMGESGIQARAQSHMRALTANSREALILRTIEDFGFDEIGEIMGLPSHEAQELVQIANREMQDRISGRVLIIEDEAIIAMDIQSIVAEMGHAITGVASTRTQAIRLGRAERPDLILADIQLADNSSGIEAVTDILGEVGDVPVIFITAFPERLLTGDRPEPAFLISKPYREEQVRSAVSQAMFFSSTETLHA